MFGITPLGWVHTLGSLPAIPVAIYMLVRYGRIVPRSTPGIIYFVFMLIGSISVFLIAKQPVSYGIGVATMVLVLVGYGVGYLPILKNKLAYIETICLTLSVFLLLVPTVSETLRRVPDGHPIVTDLKSPILLGAHGLLFFALIVGLVLQIIHLRKNKIRQ
jgi:hypothetical protein